MLKKFLKPIFLKASSLFGIPQLQQRMDDLTKRVEVYEIGGASLDQLATRKASELVEIRLNEAQSAIMSTSTLHTETMVNDLRILLEGQVSKVQRSLDMSRSLRESRALNQELSNQVFNTTPKSSLIDDDIYVALEDHFRGDPEIIRERQKQYVKYVKEVVTKEKPLLDIGCGRGEWLSLLREYGIQARGIDSNRACIEDCSRKNLDVEHADLMSYLDSVPASSLGAVTMFQVLEHLPFPVLLQVIRAVLRALTPDGIFIAEIPNSETLRVAATNFWIDPTHERPLFPGLLVFIAKQVGFSETQELYSTPLESDPDLTSLTPELQSLIYKIHYQLNGPGDFALIARA